MLLAVVLALPVAQALVTCRVACQKCARGEDLGELNDIFCSMCRECAGAIARRQTTSEAVHFDLDGDKGQADDIDDFLDDNEIHDHGSETNDTTHITTTRMPPWGPEWELPVKPSHFPPPCLPCRPPPLSPILACLPHAPPCEPIMPTRKTGPPIIIIQINNTQEVTATTTVVHPTTTEATTAPTTDTTQPIHHPTWYPPAPIPFYPPPPLPPPMPYPAYPMPMPFFPQQNCIQCAAVTERHQCTCTDQHMKVTETASRPTASTTATAATAATEKDVTTTKTTQEPTQMIDVYMGFKKTDLPEDLARRRFSKYLAALE